MVPNQGYQQNQTGAPYPPPPPPPQNQWNPPPAYSYGPQNPNVPPHNVYAYVPEPHDHTHEFEPKDISENKIFALLVYLMGVIGIIVASVAAPNSPYVKFHVRQSAKILVTELLIAILTLLLFWTVIVPIGATVIGIILGVINIICFVQVCKNKAKEPAIIRSLGFLK